MNCKVSVSVCVFLSPEGSDDQVKKEKNTMPEVETSKKDQPINPADFVKEPSTNRLKKKIEEWQNVFLVHGAIKP